MNSTSSPSSREPLIASQILQHTERYDAPNDEVSGRIGGDEPGAPRRWKCRIHVARAWERAFCEASVPQTRKVLLRSAMTMSPDHGGIFDTLLGLVRRGLGGNAGNGQQFVSWIHYEDFVQATRWLMNHEEVEGAVNIAAPHPLPNADFMQVLREVTATRMGLPATKWMLEIGAVFIPGLARCGARPLSPMGTGPPGRVQRRLTSTA